MLGKEKLTIFFCLVVLSGCATIPEPLRGDFVPVTPAHARETQLDDLWVRWGGSIASIEPTETGTCMTIVARPLSDVARPRPVDVSLGRFLACSEGYFEPDVFRPGRAVTVIGYLAGYQLGDVGEYRYNYPLVEADVVFLWPPYRVYAPY